MKKGYKVLIGIIVLIAAGFAAWKWLIKTNVVALQDGSGNTIYKMGGKYYQGTSNGDAVPIDQNEYNTLMARVEGSCTKPAGITTFDITPCDYFSYKGQLDGCGNCVVLNPIVKNCPPTAGNCDSGGQTGTLRLTESDAKNCHYSCYTAVGS